MLAPDLVSLHVRRITYISSLLLTVNSLSFSVSLSLSISDPARRSTRELDRKGGGAGEGVRWFSAATMKTKLASVE